MASQHTLCRSVLERLAQAGVLGDVALIDSWCLEGYKSYFGRTRLLTTLRARMSRAKGVAGVEHDQPHHVPGVRIPLGDPTVVERLARIDHYRAVDPTARGVVEFARRMPSPPSQPEA